MGKNRRKREQSESAAAETAAKKAKPATPADDDGVDPSRLERVNGASRPTAADQRLIVVLAGAHLETVKSGRGFGLLNVDEHSGILRKYNRDFSSARPDITHQCLLMLLDSPLNRAGRLQVFIHTAQNVLIEVNPQTRIPRTFPRFAGLMVQLLHKYSIKAADSSVKLLKVIKNPISDHLPVGCAKVLMSYSATRTCTPEELVPPPDSHVPVCLVVGAIAKGAIQTDYTDESACLGHYPLSAALTCAKLTSAFESAWGVF
eukprot:snap_masked-scaffold17_size721972-processed-gene-1.3 protein:Tk09954 transcript:snap_masked-scaffold17_size721972-processed-gene-1.3-mRNA-1 annotation:"probable ribosome biogenesis protein nep1"